MMSSVVTRLLPDLDDELTSASPPPLTVGVYAEPRGVVAARVGGVSLTRRRSSSGSGRSPRPGRVLMPCSVARTSDEGDQAGGSLRCAEAGSWQVLVSGEFGALPEHGEVGGDAFAWFVAVAVPRVVRGHVLVCFVVGVVEKPLAADVEQLALKDVLQVVTAVVVVIHVIEHSPIPK